MDRFVVLYLFSFLRVMRLKCRMGCAVSHRPAFFFSSHSLARSIDPRPAEAQPTQAIVSDRCSRTLLHRLPALSIDSHPQPQPHPQHSRSPHPRSSFDGLQSSRGQHARTQAIARHDIRTTRTHTRAPRASLCHHRCTLRRVDCLDLDGHCSISSRCICPTQIATPMSSTHHRR
jgi:hypothetical protein